MSTKQKKAKVKAPAVKAEKPSQSSAIKTPKEFVFGRENYMLMLLGIAIIIIGFVLMSGGGSDDPAVWDASEVYSSRRITLAPIVVLIGFAVEIYSVFHKTSAKHLS